MSEELEHIDQDRIDKAIWKSIGIKSVRTIADETGLKPEEVLRRKNELLDEVDVLSINQKRQRLLIELDGMARDARKRAEGVIDEYAAGLWNAATSAVKTMLTELARMERQDSGKIEALNRKRVESLVRIVRAAIDAGVPEISTRYGIPEEDLFDVFNRRLQDAAEKEEQVNKLF